MGSIILSLVTFILGIVCSYTISRNFELKTQIRMDINSFGIINENIGAGSVIIECNGAKIDTLTKTSIMFWNSGRKCITKDEILGEKCLKIEFPQVVKIFECKKIKYNEKLNKISVCNDQNVVIVKFEYLKPGNGAIIDILHNGNINQEIAPIFNLKTNNKNDVIKVNTSVDWENVEKSKERIYRTNKIINYITLVLAMIVITFFGFALPIILIKDELIALLISAISVFMCGGLCVLLILHLRNTFYLKPRNLHRDNNSN